MRLPTPRIAGAQFAFDEARLVMGWTGEWSFVGEEERASTASLRRDEEISRLGEIYLELLRVDLEDDTAILAFVNRFGILGVSDGGYGLIEPFLPHGSPRLASTGSLSHESTEDFRLGAACIHDLVAAYRHLLDPELPPPEWRQPLDRLIAIQEAAAAVGVEMSAESISERVLADGLTAGLAPFHPRIEALRDPVWSVVSTVPTYAICCLEIYNHLTERATVRRCAKQDCQVEFVRQRGRAEKHQHRLTGVIYCSHGCARAEAVRAHRARSRAERTSREQGGSGATRRKGQEAGSAASRRQGSKPPGQ